ncbi:hypothetical protein ARHIZOSPH14_25910 [Agromyces rhizosphaerae]|uniref:Uncharacterized protein n=1 Tax=Agromyces rhizosphaerae TaxID=88374 RepID=A0A9W6FPS8_9MICO|nr:hypothetical protein [Agromyces rhizosphaerae]GLI28349.1 hypothetical protein ARHIZOSPH14_25910 [Agromyces rhizosphaerae]
MEFVLNEYVQLRFDGDLDAEGPTVLTSWVWPVVVSGGREWRESDRGYADALRSLAPGTVLSTAEGTGVGIRVTFDTGVVVIHPTIDEVQVEIAMLHGFADQAWDVWRPGEESFEDVV